MLYNEDTWTRFVQKVEKGYKVKKYLHFDHRFEFPLRKNEIKDIVSNRNAVINHPFLPLIKVQIKTPRYRYQEAEEKYDLETKVRPISFASHFDTYLYAFYSFALSEKYQEYIKLNEFESCVLAYRNDLDGKCNVQFAHEAFEVIRNTGACTAIAMDIKGYFDSIDHQTLKSCWCKVLGVKELPEDQYSIFRSLSKYSYVKKNSILKHFRINLKKIPKKELPATLTDLIPGKTFVEKFNRLRKDKLFVVNEEHEKLSDGYKRFYGIPQGSALSALLSNIYLIDFDKYMYEYGQQKGFVYRRYCDDILIVVPSDKASEVNKEVVELILKYKLIIQSKKTDLIEFMHDKNGKLRGFDLKKRRDDDKSFYTAKQFKNLQYLGFEFNGQHAYIRPSSLSRYFRKMKARIVKTVSMSASKNSKSPIVFKQQLYNRYSHLGKRNFLSYAYNATKKYYKNSEGKRKEGMDSPAIRKQISRHFDILQLELESKTERRRKIKVKI